MIDIIRPISAPVSATALSGRKILMARCGGLPFDAFTPRALLVFAAIEIFAQSGCQALFAIRRHLFVKKDLWQRMRPVLSITGGSDKPCAGTGRGFLTSIAGPNLLIMVYGRAEC
jgi:hypothetical protein